MHKLSLMHDTFILYGIIDAEVRVLKSIPVRNTYFLSKISFFQIKNRYIPF